MREWVRERLGKGSESLFPPLHHVATDPEAIPFQSLPANLAIKANHGSHWVEFRRAGQAFDEMAVRWNCERWLARAYGLDNHEWAYWSIPRRIVIEELFLDSQGRMPDDLKFLMFGGRCAYAMVEHDRFGDYWQAPFDLDWRRLPFTNKRHDPPQSWPKPKGFDEMLALAEALSQGFDHLRVDFLYNEEGFLLNELTLYRGSGLGRFRPRRFDFEFGALWKLGSSSV